MKLDQLIKLRPYLYHLTAETNLESIIAKGRIFSTNAIVSKSNLTNKKEFVTTRREISRLVTMGKDTISIRDQHPLSITILNKCIEGCTVEEFIEYLNSKVFFWGKPAGLLSHYQRYAAEGERPVILRLSTDELFKLNTPPSFTHLNSGGPRASSHHGGKGSPRGLDTFKRAEDFEHTASNVHEVVFDDVCILPKDYHVGRKPDGPFRAV